ncbi:MAG: ABC transporter permease [Planctomycetota bacterium]|nr:MAG: ABC transporter permease [Planctomycetota bacterium]
MYKLLLCWRYLRTRYIALASIISVTLGVATLIVANSVMAGFSQEMQGRIHGILSDLVVKSHGAEGFKDPAAHMERIERVAGDQIAAMTPTLEIPAMLAFEVQGNWHQRQVTLIGIDPNTYGQVGDFNRYLQHPENRRQVEFELREGGYDTVDRQSGDPLRVRHRMDIAGWVHRRMDAAFRRDLQPPAERGAGAGDLAPSNAPPEELAYEGWAFTRGEPLKPGEQPRPEEMPRDGSSEVFDPARQIHTGIIMGIALAHYRLKDGSDQFFLLPGDDVTLTVSTAGTPPKAAFEDFTIVDFYESKLSEYDETSIFVPLETLQRMREMIDPETNIGYATSIQIKLRDPAAGNQVRDMLRAEFPAGRYAVDTWRDQQGPLLAAVNLESTILNVLLFMIIAVAGFGILAIFFMIVVEKTKDVGILKSLGAPSRGILGIFLGYGLALGIVGSGGGMVMGLLFVANINQIADALAYCTGQPVFDPNVYYFTEIPVVVHPLTVAWIVVGAMLIAVMASILPARRAALLHPVEALRQK